LQRYAHQTDHESCTELRLHDAQPRVGSGV